MPVRPLGLGPRYPLQFLVAGLFFQSHNRIPIAIGTMVAVIASFEAISLEKIDLLPAGFALLSRLGCIGKLEIRDNYVVQSFKQPKNHQP